MYLDLKQFIRSACKHRMDVNPRRFWTGIIMMIGSWQLIALSITTHALLVNSWLARYVDFAVQMFVGILTLFIISLIYQGLIKNRGIKGSLNYLKIARDNEAIKNGQVRHLSYGGRIGTIYARAILATSGYFLFELARVYIGVIDNSTLHGADALIYAFMFGWWIEQKDTGIKVYTRFQWYGMFISASAILFAFIYECVAKNFAIALGGVAVGIGSAIMLSCVILISSIVVYHDSVLRIAFHNCLLGFLISCFLLIITVCTYYEGNFLEVINILSIHDLKSTILVGIYYSIALLGFLQSYRYIEPVLIAMLGNSLGLGTMIISFFIIGAALNYKDIIITVILTVGSIILGVEEWRKEKK